MKANTFGTRWWMLAGMLLIAIGSAPAAAAQDPLQRVKDLYASAAYEETLAVISKLHTNPPQLEIEQYEVFSLIALGREDEAHKVIEEIIATDPLYRLDPGATSPRVEAVFKDARARVLPSVAMDMYERAKAALDRKDRDAAIDGFDRLLRVIDGAPQSSESLDDLRVLASGFLDLSKALPVAAPEPSPNASPDAAPDAAAAAADVPSSAAPIEVEVPAKAIRQELPAWVPTDPVSRRLEFAGTVRVHVGTDGHVMSVDIIRPVHPAYDQALVRAAKEWTYTPAMRGGAPVETDVIVEVRLRPQEE